MQSYPAWIYSPSRLVSTERAFLKIGAGGSSQVRDASFNGYGLNENETGIRHGFYMHMYTNKYCSYKNKNSRRMTTEQGEYVLITFSSFHTKLKRRLEGAVRAADWGKENRTVNYSSVFYHAKGMLSNPANLEEQTKIPRFILEDPGA